MKVKKSLIYIYFEGKNLLVSSENNEKAVELFYKLIDEELMQNYIIQYSQEPAYIVFRDILIFATVINVILLSNGINLWAGLLAKIKGIFLLLKPVSVF
jgi:hypothetical protein